MIRSLFVIALVPVLVLALIVACGGDEETGARLSRDEYFRELDAIGDELRESFDEQMFAVADEASDEERHEALVGYYEYIADNLEAAGRDFDTLTPPMELAKVHSDLVGGTYDVAESMRNLADEVRALDPQSLYGLNTLGFFGAVETAATRIEEACDMLEVESGGTFECDPDSMAGLGGCIEIRGGINGEPPTTYDCSSDRPSFDMAPGVSGRLVEAPQLPEQLEAVSEYLEFGGSSSGAAVIGIPLIEAASDADNIGWYTYRDEVWTLLDVPVQLAVDGSMVEGDFEAIPANLIVLRER